MEETTYERTGDLGASRQYSMKEVDEIIRRALRDNSSSEALVSEAELQEIAAKLGIPLHRLELAVRENRNSNRIEKARAAWLKKRRRGFYEHLTSYIIVNGFLFLVNTITPGPWWFFWPMLGWGVGLAFDTIAAFFPKEEDIDRGARKILVRQEFA